MIKAVIFDIDNTLYSYDPCNDAGTDAVYGLLHSRFGTEKESYESALSDSKRVIKKFNANTASSHNRFLYFQRLSEQLGFFSPELVLEMYECFWKAYFDKMELYPDALNLLCKLKKNNIRIGFCTDLTAQIQFRKIIALGLSDIPDAVVTSEECGAEKPSAVMYETILKKLGVSPENAIMIGDSPQKDVLGAKNCGIRPVLYGSDVSGYTCAKSFKELDAIIERII